MIAGEDEARAFVAERCSDEDFIKVARFANSLIAETANQNLIAKGSITTIWQRHIADSAQLIDFVPRETMEWLDLGSGAGFPGIVLAIMRPGCTFHLVESRKMRIKWLERSVTDLNLSNCRIHGSSLQNIESFPVDIITARAFAPMRKLLELSTRFSTAPTTWLLPKGQSAAQELESLKPKARKMFHVEQSATDSSAGILVGSKIGKIRNMP